MYRGLESSAPEHLPVAHKMASDVISLPIYPELDLKTVEIIFSIINVK